MAIIPDGNARWAAERGLSVAAGHRAGLASVRRVVTCAVECNIEVLTLYGLSTENAAARGAEEVNGILEQAVALFSSGDPLPGVRLRALGRLELLPVEVRRALEPAEVPTAADGELELNICLNYGGRAEIVDAVRRIVAMGYEPDAISEDLVASHLLTRGLPEPALIIRTGGELRLSNFLLWQSAYSEYVVSARLWPDFGRDDFLDALASFGRRARLMGRREPAANTR